MSEGVLGSFLDPLLVRDYAKGEWVLAADLRYLSRAGILFTAPKYFITDLASTPWLAKPFLRGMEDRKAGVIHDLLYCQNVLPRSTCDALFYEMLLVLGSNKPQAKAAYSGLRIGGGPAYNRCRGGIKVTDLAFELMNQEDTTAWKNRLTLKVEPETLPK